MFTLSIFKGLPPRLTAHQVAQALGSGLGEVAGRAQLTVARLPLFAPKTRGERFMAAFFLLLLANQQANAQTGSTIVTQLGNIRTLIYNIVNVLFIIFLSVALIRTAKKFMSGEPDAMTSIGWLIGGVMLWFGFTYFKKDIQGSMSSSAGGGLGGADGQ